jgi:hypothetical protein
MHGETSVEDGIQQAEVRTAPAPAAFPVHRNAAYNEIPAKSGVNGNAIAAFVLGLGGAVPLAIVFGIRALTQIGDRPQKGRVLVPVVFPNMASAGPRLGGSRLIGA